MSLLHCQIDLKLTTPSLYCEEVKEIYLGSFGKKCLKTDFLYKTHFFEKKTESKGPQLRLKTILFTNFLQPSTDSTKCQPAN